MAQRSKFKPLVHCHYYSTVKKQNQTKKPMQELGGSYSLSNSKILYIGSVLPLMKAQLYTWKISMDSSPEGSAASGEPSPSSVFPPQWKGLELGRQNLAATQARCAGDKAGQQSVLGGLRYSQDAPAKLASQQYFYTPSWYELLLYVSHGPLSGMGHMSPLNNQVGRRN